jgi:hypothetical protein
MHIPIIPEELLSTGLSNFAIDSTKLHFHIPEHQIISEELKAKEVLIEEWDMETGDKLNEIIKTSPQTISRGETDQTQRKYIYCKDSRGQKKVILHWKAKTLGSLYLHGLNPDTLPLLYSQIKQDALIDIEPDQLNMCTYTDTDIKRDQTTPLMPQEVLEAYFHLKDVYKPSKTIGRGITVGTSDIMLQVNQRKAGVKSIAGSFFKCYFKGGELYSADTKPFTDQYLPTLLPSFTDSLHRQEFTITGRAHAQALGIEASNLLDLLLTPQEVFLEAMHKILTQNFLNMDYEKAESQGNSKNEIIASVILYFIDSRQEGTSEAIAFQQALHVLTRRIGSRARKSHTKTLCHQIYEGLIDSGDIASTRSKTNLKEHNKNVQSFLKNFPISE